MRYFATSVSKTTLSLYQSGTLGLLNTPASSYKLERLQPRLVWAADNGCFSKQWDESTWLRFLEACLPFQNSCVWATIPDVVGDHAETVKRFVKYAPLVRDMGYRIAFVGQDGGDIDSTPWGEFDCWFAGGTTKWKLQNSWTIFAEAKRQGLITHMGRVNSKQRFLLARDAGYDSVDGTFLAFGPEKNLPRLMSWINDTQLPLL